MGCEPAAPASRTANRLNLNRSNDYLSAFLPENTGRRAAKLSHLTRQRLNTHSDRASHKRADFTVDRGVRVARFGQFFLNAFAQLRVFRLSLNDCDALRR